MPVPRIRMSLDHRTLYEILGVARGAQPAEIERAYRRHRAEMQQEAVAPDARRTVLVQNAYEILSDPARRGAYDESLRAPAEVLRRARASRHAKVALAVAGVLAGAALAGYFAWRPGEADQRLRDPREIAEAAGRAVGRLQAIDMAGATTQLGLAFALDAGSLATSCAGLAPTSQLVVRIAQRQVPAHVAAIYAGDGVCRLSADGMGSWPLPLAPSVPATGAKVYATQLDSTGQLALAEGSVRRVWAEEGATTIEVTGPAFSQLAGGPLLDGQGRVLGVGQGHGRYRRVPSAWMAEMNAPPPPATPAPKREKPPTAQEEVDKAAHERAQKLRLPDAI